MVTLAEELSQEVTDLLDELKSDGLAQECLITKRASGAYDPTTGTTAVTETTQTVVGSIFDSLNELTSPSTVTNINSSLIKSGDRILLVMILFLTVFLFIRIVIPSINPDNNDISAIITIDGVLYARYPLNDNRIINTSDKTRIEIKDGRIRILMAFFPIKPPNFLIPFLSIGT